MKHLFQFHKHLLNFKDKQSISLRKKFIFGLIESIIDHMFSNLLFKDPSCLLCPFVTFSIEKTS